MVPEIGVIISIVKEFLDVLPEAESVIKGIVGDGDGKTIPKDQIHKVISHVGDVSKNKSFSASAKTDLTHSDHSISDMANVAHTSSSV